MVKRPFLSARYLPSDGGRLAPAKPTRCPHWKDDGLPCFVVVKQWRARRCGPGHAILACECYTHGGFQIYPIGWWPLGRVSLLGDGDSLARAIRDGAAGQRWPEHALLGQATARTQRRWTSTWSKIFGVAPGLDDAARMRAALALGVDTLRLSDAAKRIRAGPTSRGGRALELLGILRSLDPAGLLLRLLRRGHEYGFWGKPIFAVRGSAPLFNLTRS